MARPAAVLPAAAHTDATDVAARIVAWQRRHGRHGLPWQQGRDAYRVWLSEIMLQQTQVTTVLGYYARFLDRFPDVVALADAPADEVMRLWAGLGYYARARNLHRCAQVVRDDWGGRFPDDVAALANLPGIGPSTAAAIAAFAYGVREPILDGNVKRVLARYFGVQGVVTDTATSRQLWTLARAALDAAPASLDMAAYTQGQMDLGALCCTRSQPDCAACPLQSGCHAAAHGLQQQLPTPRPRKQTPLRSCHMLVLESRAGIHLLRQPTEGLWGGLWSLPRYDDEAALSQACRQAGLNWADARPLPSFQHVFTHFRLDIVPWLLQGEPDALLDADQEVVVATDDLGRAPLPAPVREILAGLYGRWPAPAAHC